MKLAVVIPAYNAGAHIGGVLQRLALAGPELSRVIVVDDGSDDDTGARLQAWADRLSASYGDSDVLVYFNNDPGGAAVTDAVVFAEAVRRTGRTPTRVPTLDQASGAAWAPAGTPQAVTPLAGAGPGLPEG